MANKKRLIDANELRKALPPNDGMLMYMVKRAMRDTPTVEAVEVVHGEWSTIEDDYTGMIASQCSVCNQEYWFEDEPPLKIYNYCPNCGAKMDGDGNGTLD